MHATKKFATLTATFVVAGVTSLIAAPAQAEEPLQDAVETLANGILDPETFGGTLVIAAPSGMEVVTDVEPGEAPSVIAAVQTADVAGIPQTRGRVVESRAGCGQKVRSVAGPFGYATSVQGCAVAGYSGYQREYSWSKTSDTGLCTKGRGFSGNNAGWYSTGCNGGNNRVPWGNVLAYTQMQGMSMAGVVGATYDWRA